MKEGKVDISEGVKGILYYYQINRKRKTYFRLIFFFIFIEFYPMEKTYFLHFLLENVFYCFILFQCKITCNLF